MTYNVFRATLNPTQSINRSIATVNVFELWRVIWRKSPILTYPTCVCCLRWRWLRLSFAAIFSHIKLESLGYRVALFTSSYV